MGILFITVLIIVILLVLLLVWIILQTVKKLNEKVKEDYMRSLGEYDQYIEEKSKELSHLREMIELAAERPASVENKSGKQVEYVILDEDVAYRDDSFAEQYNVVKNKFASTAKQSAIKTIKDLLNSSENEELLAYKEMRQLFTSDVCYKLLTLPDNEKMTIMQEIAEKSSERAEIFNSFYENAGSEKFVLDEFIRFLDDYIYKNDSTVSVYSHSGEAFSDICDADESRIRFIEDKSIMEGYVIRFRDRIYDFSV